MSTDLKIGLSLSQCVADILSGKVSEDFVLKIITSTKYPDKEAMLGAVTRKGNSTMSAWVEASQKAGDQRDVEEIFQDIIALVSRLWDEGKIVQPRLKCDWKKPNIVASGDIWVNDEASVVYNEAPPGPH